MPKLKPSSCEWFTRCTRPATGTTPHLFLGDIPTCDHCHTFVTGEVRQPAPSLSEV